MIQSNDTSIQFQCKLIKYLSNIVQYSTRNNSISNTEPPEQTREFPRSRISLDQFLKM